MAIKELDTIAADHPEYMRALVAEVARLALLLVEPNCCRAGYTVRKPCTSGYMVATQRVTQKKAQRNGRAKSLISLVGREGLEPTTKGL